MASTYITLHTESGNALRWTDDYDGVSIVDLQSFLRQIHEAAASIEGELMKRQPERLSTIPGEVGKCCERLHNTARELDVRERLDSKTAKHVNDAVDILGTPKTNAQTRPYQDFLYDVLYHCGPSVTLLCAASFGRKKIIDLGKHGRVGLLAYVRSIRRLLETPTLEDLASEHKIPHLSSPELVHLKSQPRKRASEANRHGRDDSGHESLEVGAIDNLSTIVGLEHPRKRICVERRHERLLDQANQPGLQPRSSPSLGPDLVHNESYQLGEVISPGIEIREMKHICTNAPASTVSSLPEPFRTAVHNSKLWKWERNESELETTGCLTTLFPKDNKQDVSFTFWCGYNDGYHLCSKYGLQLAMSS